MLEKRYAINYLKKLLLTDSGHEAEAGDGTLEHLNKRLEKFKLRIGAEKCDAIEQYVNKFFNDYCFEHGEEDDISFSGLTNSFNNYSKNTNEGRQPK